MPAKGITRHVGSEIVLGRVYQARDGGLNPCISPSICQTGFHGSQYLQDAIEFQHKAGSTGWLCYVELLGAGSRLPHKYYPTPRSCATHMVVHRRVPVRTYKKWCTFLILPNISRKDYPLFEKMQSLFHCKSGDVLKYLLRNLCSTDRDKIFKRMEQIFLSL